jgi:hypothetical protein
VKRGSGAESGEHDRASERVSYAEQITCHRQLPFMSNRNAHPGDVKSAL